MEDTLGLHDSAPHQRELIALGLTSYEARTYLALLRHHGCVAADLARESGVPRQRIYDVLEGLVERGLAKVLPGQVNRYAAVDPASGVGRLMAGHRAAISRLEQTTARLVESLVPIWSEGRIDAEPLDYVEVIRDRRVLGERFAELQTTAEHSLLTLAKAPYLIVDNPEGLKAAERLTQSGGVARCVYESGGIESAEVTADIVRFVQAGEQARVAACVPMRLCIADGARVLMSLPDSGADRSYTTNVLIEHPALALCLTYAYETIWAQAEPFDTTLL
jgi:HTH-type transcriptional regulator, sugar sensing transcriptional regulator